jgi:hypothetical protein
MPDGTLNTSARLTESLRHIHAVHAGRSDRRTARVVYQAQALRRAFGRSAALTFMLAKRVPAELTRRILNMPDHQLRR